ncbi:MAG: hypothetical protein J2P20_20130 [Pseudonocardia sp.]|nr:hypothetical protein [Pseudonocardia sp.]
MGAALGWAATPSEPDGPTLPVPSFSGQPPAARDPANLATRSTLLPIDCADVLSKPVDAAALLAQPVGSLDARGIVGMPAPSVGMLERLTCTYHRVNQQDPVLVLWMAAFSDAGAAADQRDRNIADQRGDTMASRDVPFGRARATLLTQPSQYLLMLAYDRYDITLTLPKGVVPDAQVEPVLVDLARRVWPDVAPPAATAPPGGTASPAVTARTGEARAPRQAR